MQQTIIKNYDYCKNFETKKCAHTVCRPFLLGGDDMSEGKKGKNTDCSVCVTGSVLSKQIEKEGEKNSCYGRDQGVI